MSLDDIQSDEIPTLCDECGEKCFRVAGWLALVRDCEKCKRPKCEHCYDNKDAKICTECMGT